VYVKLQAGARKIEVELTTVSSNHHVELNPSDAGFQDRYVVQEIIKEMAKNRPLDVAGNRGFKDNGLSVGQDKQALPVDLERIALCVSWLIYIIGVLGGSVGSERGGQTLKGGSTLFASYNGEVQCCMPAYSMLQ
jgi:hypothetical protein